MRYPPANRARNRTKETYYIKSKKGKDLKRVKFTCEICGAKDLKSTQVELDHTIPIVSPVTGFIGWNEYISRMFVDEQDYKLLCIPCHLLKTSLEDAERVKYNNLADIRKPRKPKKVKKKLDKK